MRAFDSTLLELQANLAFDENLLLDAETLPEDPPGALSFQGEALRIWEWRQLAVVMGVSGKTEIDVHEDACAKAGVPILRRASGGGTVLLGPGCLLFSLVLAYDRHPDLFDVKASYRWILNRFLDALPLSRERLAVDGASDMTFDGLKFSGNAQRRKRRHLLQHGTILYDADLSLVPRFLKEPPRQPEYRARRTHSEFIRNLPCSRDEIVASLRRAWLKDAV